MFRSFCMVLAVVVVVWMPISVVAADGKNVRMASTGWSVPSDAADSDDSMTGGFVSELQGKGNLGKYRRKNAGDVADWDFVSLCDFDSESGQPSGILLYYLTLSSVIRTSNGDLLELEMSSSPPSTFCFNFVDNQSFTYEVYTDAVGGTGRFSGVTGSLVTGGSGKNLQNMSQFNGHTRGVLYLERNTNHDDDGDDDD